MHIFVSGSVGRDAVIFEILLRTLVRTIYDLPRSHEGQQFFLLCFPFPLPTS
jgi:hypothetical protein